MTVSPPGPGMPRSALHLALHALVPGVVTKARLLCVLLSIATFPAIALAQAAVPPPTKQNPSPMVEHARAHGRIEERERPGERLSIDGPHGKPVEVYIPESTNRAGALRLLVHFHGAPFIPEYAASRARNGYVVAVVNVGPGSGGYEQAFNDPAAFDSLVARIRRHFGRRAEEPVTFESVTLSGFSAGHGAIRAILRDPQHFAAVDAVLLLDGLHTGYVPAATVLAEGGQLDASKIDPFLRLAEAAARGEKRFLVTHSEIFPGTFASTTETADYLIQALGLRRTPVLAWGPVGMQQLSELREGKLLVLGYAGNSAPDHIDHLHGMDYFLALLQDLERAPGKTSP